MWLIVAPVIAAPAPASPPPAPPGAAPLGGAPPLGGPPCPPPGPPPPCGAYSITSVGPVNRKYAGWPAVVGPYQAKAVCASPALISSRRAAASASSTRPL